jgi:hypothetical protein
LTASTAPGLKTPDLSPTLTLRGMLLGFGISGLAHSWYLMSTQPAPPRLREGDRGGGIRSCWAGPALDPPTPTNNELSPVPAW